MKISKNNLRLKRKKRIRAKIFGTAKRPRLAIFRSLRDIYVQVIDDQKGKTLVSAKISEIKKAKNDSAGAMQTGELIAKKCKIANISEVIFDRGGYKYHGKVKALAEGVRKGGIKL